MYWHSLNEELRRQFGGKVYKLALSGGMTCPNRDGTLDTRGCIFCDGAGTFAARGGITEQLEAAKGRVADKAKSARYIAYFQDFTNTYAPAERLRELFSAALGPEETVALSVATRPDCLPPPVLKLLQELNGRKPVWVELGLQTIHPATAAWMRRGYDLPVFDEAVRNLKAIGVTVVVHQILGLPGETPEEMAETAEYIGKSGADGIKFHLLHVLRGTDLEAEWRAGAVRPMELDEYIAALEGCIRRIPPELVIHRLTGDGAKRDLLAPLWSGDKKQVLNAIRAAFLRDDLIQGEALNRDSRRHPNAP